MRSIALLSAVAALFIASPASSHETWRDVVFSARVPCGPLCPSWLADANVDVDGDGHDEVFFQPCESPLPWVEGTTYDDVVTEAAPHGARLLDVEIFPIVDHDLFVCELGDTYDHDGRPSEELASGANLLGVPCAWDPLFLGCPEAASLLVHEGVQVVLRAYNWSDPATVRGRYRYGSVQ